MSLNLPPLHLLQLRLRAAAPIRGLPHYHGPQWFGMFNFLLTPCLPPGATLSKASFRIHPVETGVSCYERDEPLHLGITFPSSSADAVVGMLRDFNGLKAPYGHFQPGKTLHLEEATCRLSGQRFSPDRLDPSLLAPLFPELLGPEVEALVQLDAFSLRLFAPLLSTVAKK